MRNHDTYEHKIQDPVIPERFSRTALLLGDNAIKKLADSHVTVVGLGAVGTNAAEAIVRSGVGKIRLVDFDIIRESNVNRQLLALNSTIGKPKVEAARSRLKDINPDLEIECFETFFHEDTFRDVFNNNTHIVVDAIDSLTPKLKLLELLHERGIPVVSSMGAAWKTDPLAVRVGDLSDTRVCPLAARIRKHLRKRGINGGIRCVYSLQQPVKPKTKEENPAPEEEYYKRGRDRQPAGSISYMTGIFGYMTAWAALDFLQRK